MNKGHAPSDVEAVLGGGRSAGGRIRRMMRYAVGLAVLAAAVVVAWLWLAGGAGETTRYVTAPVTRGALTVLVTATGSVEPTNLVEISSELSGTVRTVLVDYNSVVTRGQVLAELDRDKLEAEAQSARANLASTEARVIDAEATLLEAELDFNRKQSLSERRVASTYDLERANAVHERAKAALSIAKADVEVAQADLRLREINLSKAAIISPINGVVLSRSVDPGQTVAASLQAPVLFQIAEDLREMEIQVDVDEADIGALSEGQKASFTVDAYPERTFTGTVDMVRYGSEVVQGVVTYKAILVTDNSELLLRPGMTATAEITVREIEDAQTVPNAALRFSPPAETEEDSRSLISRLLPGPPRFRSPDREAETGAGRTIWVLRDGAPVAVSVTVGASDGARTEIVEGGLTEGDRVIVDSETTGG